MAPPGDLTDVAEYCCASLVALKVSKFVREVDLTLNVK
jgi:hypothetical protein